MKKGSLKRRKLEKDHFLPNAVLEKPEWRSWVDRGLFLLLLAVIVIISHTETGWDFLLFLKKGEGFNGIPQVISQQPLQIYFLDVGKADAMIITTGDHHVLIDAGTYADETTVEIWLKKLGIEELDAVFASHPDYDHIGGMGQVLRAFPVDLLIVPEIPEHLTESDPDYQSMLDAMGEGTQLKIAAIGEQIQFGEIFFEILGPLGMHTDLNNYSLVQKLTFGQRSVLFCGDTEKRGETALLTAEADLVADVLKVGHHGSETSSGAAFLEAVQGQYAVISAGPDRNNLPKPSVLRRLEEVGMEIHRTDLEGTVMMSTDGEHIWFAGEKAY